MKIHITIMAFVFAGVVNLWAVSEKDFALNIVHLGEPVREIMEGDKRRVAIPFDSEYEIRLKNQTGRRATARVWIDGTLATKLGDVVIPANGKLDLERFLDASLTDGKRFKFVSLEHADVDDPSREENGLIEVEFRLEKAPAIYYRPLPYTPWPVTNFWLGGLTNYLILTLDSRFVFCASDSGMSACQIDGMHATEFLMIPCSATLPGATVEGSHSGQMFHRVRMDMEDVTVTLCLWLRGLKESNKGEADDDNTSDTDRRVAPAG